MVFQHIKKASLAQSSGDARDKKERVHKGRGELGHTTVEEEERNLMIFLHRIKDLDDQKEKEED